MNLEHAAHKILGIRNANDPARLLGIAHWDRSVATLESALRTRVAQILSHPMRHSPEANFVRAAIKKAEQILRNQCINKQETHLSKQESTPSLTALDQSIIAVLVSEGGWNRQSRSRLVGVAAAYGLTVGGLLRILSALADSARSGQGPLALANRETVSPDRSWATVPVSVKRQGVIDELMDEAAARLMPSLKEQTPEAIIKLSVIFGLLTIIAIALGLMVLNRADEMATSTRHTADVLLQSPSTTASKAVDAEAGSTHLHFPEYPTFEVDIFSAEVGDLVDLAADVPRSLQSVVSDISSAGARGESVKEGTIGLWNKSIDIMSRAWPFLDHALQEEVRNLILDAISFSSQLQQLPSLLLSSFRVDSAAVAKSFGNRVMSFSRKPWILEQLARVSCSSQVIPSTKTLAKNMAAPSRLSCEAQTTRREALRQMGIDLVRRTEFDTNTLPLWEQWLAMVHRDPSDAVADALLVQTLEQILKSAVDLTRPSNTRKVLGRLVVETDWARTNQLRDALLGFYIDQSISQVDLWAVTGMLVDAGTVPWYKSEYAIEINDDMQHRTAVANSLRSIWPESSSTTVTTHFLVLPAGFDPTLVNVWLGLISNCTDVSFSYAARFSIARRLNEIAASIWLGRPSRAWELIGNLEQSPEYWRRGEANVTKGVKSSGLLSQQFKNSNRDAHVMMELLNALRSSNYSKLHMKDATTLARAALFHSDAGNRQEAVALICEKFAHSPEVALALVNVLTPSAKTPQVESLVAYLSDDILPARHDSLWLVAARRAFVQHALTADNKELKELDEAALTAAASAIGEALLVDPTRIPPSHETTISQAYRQLVESWSRRLGNYSTLDEGVTLGGSGNVLEDHLKKQILYLHRIQELESRWSGSTAVHNDLQEITNANTLIEQIYAAEVATLLVWKRAIKLALQEFDEQEKQP